MALRRRVFAAGPGGPSPMARPLLPEATGVNAVYRPQVEAAMLATPVPPGSEVWMALRHRAGIRAGRDDVRAGVTPGRPVPSLPDASGLVAGANAAGAGATRRSRPARPAGVPV